MVAAYFLLKFTYNSFQQTTMKESTSETKMNNTSNEHINALREIALSVQKCQMPFLETLPADMKSGNLFARYTAKTAELVGIISEAIGHIIIEDE